MFSVREQLQEKLQNCLKETLEKTETPLVFGHVCWGVLTKPGALRLTEIETRPKVSTPLLKYKEKYGTNHEDAFRRHIIRFGRSGTLLDWITLWMYENCEFNPRGLPKVMQTFSFLVSEEIEASPFFLKKDNCLVVSQKFFRSLLPENLINQYLDAIYTSEERYQNDNNLDTVRFLAEQLIGARFAALEVIKSDEQCYQHLKSLSALYSQEETPTDYYNWMFLGALQTGLMYVDASRVDKSQLGGFVSTGCCYNVLNNEASRENPLLILSAVLPSSATKPETLAKKLKRILAGAIETVIRTIPSFKDRPIINGLPEPNTDQRDTSQKVSIIGVINGEMSTAFEVHAFPKWTPYLMFWLSLLTDRMRNTIHEGQLLNFCFVVADRSQILDSGLFEVANLEFPKEQDKILPWDSEGNIVNESDIETLLSQTRRLVGKKNYAWFQEGKYALLWDATFPSLHPQSLIRFKDSSWDVFVNHVRMGKGKENKATRVAVAMTYVRADGSGGVIIKGRQILSFRKGQLWNIGVGKRHEELEKRVKKHLIKWGLKNVMLNKTLEIMCRTLLAIADDPHTGCMLVLFKKDRQPPFPNMGKPWMTENGNDPLQMKLDELTALMSMDGATCLYVKNSKPKIVFRCLVKIPEATPKVIKEADANKYLDGEGSRKWSGAYAATRREVAIVISVSQDGPIYIFETDENEKEVNIAVL